MTAQPEIKRSTLYKTLRGIYFFIAGTPTTRNILNFKYLTTYRLHKDLHEVLKPLSGSVVDFGCGTKPYKTWFKKTTDYIGVDLYPGPEVEFVVSNGKIPISGEAFDFALSTQVFEHTESLNYLNEIHRLLKHNGTLIISVPFLYHIHENRDYRRFTKKGLVQVLEDAGFEVTDVRIQGGIGSTLTIMKFYFIDDLVRNQSPRWLQILLAPLYPIWFFLIVPLGNVIGYLFDKIDNTEKFYNNILAVAQKK